MSDSTLIELDDSEIAMLGDALTFQHTAVFHDRSAWRLLP